VIVEKQETLEIRIESEKKGNQDTKWRYTIHRLLDDDKTQQHSQGMVEPLIEDTPQLNLSDLQQRCQRSRFQAEDCYAGFSQIGLLHKDRIQAVDYVCIGDNEMLGKLVLPKSMLETQTDFVLHPAIMDSALQATAGLYLGGLIPGSTRPMLPFALNRLDVFFPAPEHVWVWIRPCEGSRLGDTIQKLDMDLCDEQGNVFACMRGFTSRVLAADTTTSSPQTLLMKPVWHSIDSPSTINKESIHTHYVLSATQVLEVEGLPPTIKYVNLMEENQSHERAGLYQQAALRLLIELQKIQALHLHDSATVCIQLVTEDNDIAGLNGMLHSFAREWPSFQTQSVITQSNVDAQTLIQHSLSGHRVIHIPINASQTTQVQHWEEIAPLPTQSVNTLWQAQGVYLIAGGNGGIGRLLVADAVSQNTAMTIAVCGRGPFGPTWMADKSITTSNVSLVYHSVDLSDASAVQNMVRQLEGQYGSFNGVIHSAGCLNDSLITDKTPEQFNTVLAPKVEGITVLDHATEHMSLDFFVAFSSLAAAVGNPGQTDYATANAYLDRFIRERNQRAQTGKAKGAGVSINWPLWEEGGMQVSPAMRQKIKQQSGLIPLQTQAALDALHQSLTLAKEHKLDQLLVLQGDASQIRKTFQMTAMPHSVSGKTASTMSLNNLVSYLKTKQKKSNTEYDHESI